MTQGSETATYVRIASYYREAILAGDLKPGTKLPSNKELAANRKVAVGTVVKALNQLTAEGLVRTSPRGTFVADDPMAGVAAKDRFLRARQTRSVLMEGETSIVTSAGLVVPPLYVAEILDLDHGDQVVRREFTTGRGKTRLSFQVRWYPAHFAASLPDLLSTNTGKNDDMFVKVQEALNRPATYGRDDMHGRDATAREASALGLPVGSSILAGAHRWGDDQGVIEYGEWCLPPRMTVGYEYKP